MSNHLIAMISNRSLQCKFVIFSKSPRLSIEDFAGGKPTSLLNAKLDIRFITKLIQTLKKLKDENKPQSELISFSERMEDGSWRIVFNMVISMSEAGVFSISVSAQNKGNFDFPLMSPTIIGKGSEPMPERERSLIEVDTLINLLECSYSEYIKLKNTKADPNDPATTSWKKPPYGGGGGGGYRPQGQGGGGYQQRNNYNNNYES